jgi:hypothetical protein
VVAIHLAERDPRLIRLAQLAITIAKECLYFENEMVRSTSNLLINLADKVLDRDTPMDEEDEPDASRELKRLLLQLNQLSSTIVV